MDDPYKRIFGISGDKDADLSASAPVSCSTAPASLPEDVKVKILAARDAIVQEDFDEAYYQLYSIADPDFISFDPWAGLGGR